MSENVTAVAMPDEGIVYAYSTVHAAPRKWITPYAIGYVDLPNGARVFSHLQGDGLAVGARVRLAAGVVGVTPEGAPRTQSVFVVKGETP